MLGGNSAGEDEEESGGWDKGCELLRRATREKRV